MLAYMERVMAPRTMGSTCGGGEVSSPWRLLIVDAYAAQKSDVVRRFAWQRRYALCIHGGGAAGMCQPNDTDLDQEIKRRYIEMETADAAEQQRLRPHGIPVPSPQDCIARMAAIWGQP